MHNHEFYRGLLCELEKMSVESPTSNPPSSPAPSMATPVLKGSPPATATLPTTPVAGNTSALPQPSAAPAQSRLGGMMSGWMNNLNTKAQSAVGDLKNTITTNVGPKLIDDKVSKMGWGDLISHVTGSAKVDPMVEEAFKAHPELRQHAIQQMLGRAGQLSGEFLTQNWGKIAAIAGGSGIAIMLLKQIMGGHEQQKQQPQRPQGPRFL